MIGSETDNTFATNRKRYRNHNWLVSNSNVKREVWWVKKKWIIEKVRLYV